MSDLVINSENSENSEKKVNSNEKPLSFGSIFAYGSGNFASQLSWTMVSTYLILFYTNAAGIAASAVALIMLIVRIWGCCIRSNSWRNNGTYTYKMGTF